MCIAIMKPEGVEIPSNEVLQRCWDANSHGAGYAFLRDGLVNIRKGYMESCDQVIDSLDTLSDEEKKGAMLIHFRIKSAGTKCPEQTHPFPMVDDYNVMRQRKWQGMAAVVHNGTFHDIKPETQNESDTMRFVKEVLCRYPQWLANTITDDKQRELVYRLVTKSCRVGLMDNQGNMWRSGDWDNADGVWYSNSDYKERPKAIGYGATMYRTTSTNQSYTSRYGESRTCSSCLGSRLGEIQDEAMKNDACDTCEMCTLVGGCHSAQSMHKQPTCPDCANHKCLASAEPCKWCLKYQSHGLTKPSFIESGESIARRKAEAERKLNRRVIEEQSTKECLQELKPFGETTCLTCKYEVQSGSSFPCSECAVEVDDVYYAGHYKEDTLFSLYCRNCGCVNDSPSGVLCVPCSQTIDYTPLPF